MALKSTITAPPVVEGVTQVNSNGDTIIANPVVFVDSQGEFITLSNGKIPVEVESLSVSINNSLTLAAESGYLTSRNPTLTNTAVQVKASDGLVMGWNFINTNSVTVYVKFYNLATNITVGTSPVLLTQAVPGGSASNSGINFLEVGLVPQEVFSVGISIACVTGLADNSTTAPITPIYAEVRYK